MQQYRVIVGGILKKNGELAPFNTILDEVELDDAYSRVKEGYVEEVKAKSENVSAGSEKPDNDTKETGNDLIDNVKPKPNPK